MTRCVAGYRSDARSHRVGDLPAAAILEQMRAGKLQRAQLVAKGSLFLGRMTAISDGMSVLIEP